MKNNIKRIVAVILVIVTLTLSTAFAEGFVKFTKNADCYKKPGSGKTDTVIRHDSVAEKLDHEDGYTLVKLDKKHSMWVKDSCVKTAKKAKKARIAYSEGGSKLSSEGKSKKVKGYTTVLSKGKCNIRKKPCLSGKSLGTFKKGMRFDFTGKVSTDSRGVEWYSVRTDKGANAWVSSVYCKLEK